MKKRDFIKEMEQEEERMIKQFSFLTYKANELSKDDVFSYEQKLWIIIKDNESKGETTARLLGRKTKIKFSYRFNPEVINVYSNLY